MSAMGAMFGDAPGGGSSGVTMSDYNAVQKSLGNGTITRNANGSLSLNPNIYAGHDALRAGLLQGFTRSDTLITQQLGTPVGQSATAPVVAAAPAAQAAQTAGGVVASPSQPTLGPVGTLGQSNTGKVIPGTPRGRLQTILGTMGPLGEALGG